MNLQANPSDRGVGWQPPNPMLHKPTTQGRIDPSKWLIYKAEASLPSAPPGGFIFLNENSAIMSCGRSDPQTDPKALFLCAASGADVPGCDHPRSQRDHRHGCRDRPHRPGLVQGRGKSLKAEQQMGCKTAEEALRKAERLAPMRLGVVAFSASADTEMGD